MSGPSKQPQRYYRPEHVLKLMKADQDGETPRCPACKSTFMARTPPERWPVGQGQRVTIRCLGCSREMSYTPM